MAVICGTVDMIGSRLLFSGYGVGFKGRPLHAGFLGQDALLVHDEAHLEPAFQSLLDGIKAEQDRFRYEKSRFRVMELSATSRGRNNQPSTPPFGLTDLDRRHPEVLRRIQATKKLVLTLQSTAKVGEQLASTAIETFKDSGKAIIVFARFIEDVNIVAERLAKANVPVKTLTGTMRGWEREGLTRDPIFARFLPKDNRPEAVATATGTVCLVCTSAGEVGINISADHLVCDLTTFESMAQRFGRVNRFGDNPDTQVHVIHPGPEDFEDGPPDPQRKMTLGLLERLGGNASPEALSQLPEDERAAAFAPMPTILPTTDILHDAWSLTSIRDRMPGRPAVEPYLHGIRDWEPPETHVAWREEVGVIVDDLLKDYPPEDLLDEYPLKPHELLRDRTDRVWKELVKLAARHPQSPVWIVADQGHVTVRQLDDFIDLDKKRADEQLGKRIVLLPHNIGGLTAEGMLNGNHPPTPTSTDKPTNINNDVADKMTDKAGRLLRVRLWDGAKDFDINSKGMRDVRPRIDLPNPDDDEDSDTKSWHWFELPVARDNSKNAVDPVLLDSHIADVEAQAKQIVDGLTFDPDAKVNAGIKQAILLAAKYHDLGKRRELWQRSIGRPMAQAEIWFGKSGKQWKPRDITDYRHEFGSLVDLQRSEEFQSLGEDVKELVQHLIAAHHGQARPHFTATQAIDPESADSICEALAAEVPRRFARLQRKFGRWGLAYIESILRAADWHASANPSSHVSEDAR